MNICELNKTLKRQRTTWKRDFNTSDDLKAFYDNETSVNLSN